MTLHACAMMGFRGITNNNMADDVNVSKQLESTVTDQSTTEVPVRDADIETKTSVVTDYGTSSQQGGLSTHRVSFLSQLMSEVMAEEENQRLEEVCSYTRGGGGGALEKISTGMLVSLFWV